MGGGRGRERKKGEQNKQPFMKKYLIPVILLFQGLACGQVIKSYDYCYENNKGICVYSTGNKEEVKTIAVGTSPCLSPDGRELSYTDNENNLNRNICILNLTTNHKKTLNVKSKLCFGSVWSPNGRYIAYQVLYAGDKNGWGVAIIDTNNEEPIDIAKGRDNFKYYSPTWTADSKNIDQTSHSHYLHTQTHTLFLHTQSHT
jgi:Tol biopolymer transport system component